MRRAYKYEIQLQEESTVEMPNGAEIIDSAARGDSIFLWAIVDPDEHLVERHFHVFGTGHDIDNDDLSYIDTAHTVQRIFGSELRRYVWHIFEESTND